MCTYTTVLQILLTAYIHELTKGATVAVADTQAYVTVFSKLQRHMPKRMNMYVTNVHELFTGAQSTGADALAAALGGDTCDMTGMDEKVDFKLCNGFQSPRDC
jgi:hypothetical protein